MKKVREKEKKEVETNKQTKTESECKNGSENTTEWMIMNVRIDN